MASLLPEKIVLSNPPKTFGIKSVQVEPTGNLDKAIEKMKRDIYLELEEREIAQLKCCLLFLCGMPFSKISDILKISKGSISRFLNDEKLEDLLSFEYRILLQLNRSRLQPESTKSKITRAVAIFIEQNGNYQETMRITGFSDRTLSRYFSDPKLEKILDNPVLYQSFLSVKEKHISEVKRKAAIQNIKNQKLKEQLEILNPINIVQKRYLKLAKAILIENITDIKGLMKYTGMSERNIEEYLDDFSRVESFFPSDILTLLKQKSLVIYSDESAAISADEYEKSIIALYLNGRYSYNDIKEITGLRGTQVDYILQERSKILLSASEYQKFEEHKKEVSKLLLCCPKDCYLIKDERMIQIVKPEIFYVHDVDYQLLSVLVDFLTTYQSISVKEPTSDSNLFSMEMYLLAKKNQLAVLLNQTAFLKIQKCLEIESLLIGNQLQQKYELIIVVVKVFFFYNLDLEITAEQLEMSVESLIQILRSDFISINYGSIIDKYIKQSIEDYRIMQKSKKNSNAYTYQLRRQ